MGSIPTGATMKTHTIIVKEEDWAGSKYRTQNWEKRVNITQWVHDYEKGQYEITIGIK